MLLKSTQQMISVSFQNVKSLPNELTKLIYQCILASAFPMQQSDVVPEQLSGLKGLK